MREARFLLSLRLCFLSIPLPGTKCRFWLWCLANCPSRANSNNPSSGKPFWTLLYHENDCSLLYLLCTDEVSPLGSCPRPDSDEVRLISFPGHRRKQTTEHPALGCACSHCCIYHDDTCVRKARYPPKWCENHKLYFSSLFFSVSNLGAQCVP